MSYRAVCCDLLTALVDSWSLWESVAGDPQLGTRWRLESLRLVTASGRYRDYEQVVVEAARRTDVPGAAAAELIRRWDGGLRAYADVGPALSALEVPFVLVTNTSQRLAEAAAAAIPARPRAVVSAEMAGWYKPDDRAYAAGWRAAGADRPEECLFVAGSPHDVAGAAAAGHDVFWVNRRGAPAPAGAPPPRWQAATLDGLGAALAEAAHQR